TPQAHSRCGEGTLDAKQGATEDTGRVAIWPPGFEECRAGRPAAIQERYQLAPSRVVARVPAGGRDAAAEKQGAVGVVEECLAGCRAAEPTGLASAVVAY